MGDPAKERTAPQKVEVDAIRTIQALESRTFAKRFLNFNPHFTLFRRGFRLCVELVHQLGEIPPKGERDRVLRDLACDILDCLWLAEHALLHGYDNQMLVLLRRAYEATSLMAYFLNFPDKVAEWQSGKQIENSAIREALATAPVPEPREELKAIYKVYSLFAHVNRDTIYERLLGEKNRLTLGCQGNVDEKTVGANLRELLAQTMWFVDVFNFAFKEVGAKLGDNYMRPALAYRAEVQSLAADLPALF